jgi:hypothetical protein
MSQDLIAQEAAGGGNGGTAFGFVTGSTCTTSGTYRASNRYMDIVAIYVVGEIFRAFADGKKTTWYPLTASLSSKNSSGGFTSVKVDAVTI